MKTTRMTVIMHRLRTELAEIAERLCVEILQQAEIFVYYQGECYEVISEDLMAAFCLYFESGSQVPVVKIWDLRDLHPKQEPLTLHEQLSESSDSKYGDLRDVWYRKKDPVLISTVSQEVRHTCLCRKVQMQVASSNDLLRRVLAASGNEVNNEEEDPPGI